MPALGALCRSLVDVCHFPSPPFSVSYLDVPYSDWINIEVFAIGLEDAKLQSGLRGIEREDPDRLHFSMSLMHL